MASHNLVIMKRLHKALGKRIDKDGITDIALLDQHIRLGNTILRYEELKQNNRPGNAKNHDPDDYSWGIVKVRDNQKKVRLKGKTYDNPSYKGPDADTVTDYLPEDYNDKEKYPTVFYYEWIGGMMPLSEAVYRNERRKVQQKSPNRRRLLKKKLK